MTTAIIIVDHGSRAAQSNDLLLQLVDRFSRLFGARYSIVEPAHMELAEPTIATAYARCAARGAERIVVCPFFLGPGKHWQRDIPALVSFAARNSSVHDFVITEPLGLDDLVLRLLDKRIGESISAERTETCVHV